MSNVGIPIEVAPADIDERAIETERCAGLDPRSTARILSEAKALAVSARMPGRLVLGSDQTMELEGKTYTKATNLNEARQKLRLFSGRTHRLYSGFCFAQDGKVIETGVEAAELAMRELSGDFIDAYLATAGPSVLGSVGAYEIEKLGPHLFDSIEGDWFTILGLPLRQILRFLRQNGLLLA